MANIFAFPGYDLRLAICAEIPSAEKIDSARAMIHDRTGIATSVAIIRPDKLEFAPGCAAVFGSSDERIDISAISSCPALTKSQ
jgi:hypothetical protein